MKMHGIVMTGVNIAVVAGIFLFLDTAWAVDGIIKEHPAFRNEKVQPSRALFEAHQSGAQSASQRDGAMAKMNQIEFRQTIQRLTAPNAFRIPQPVAAEKMPNPNRRPQ